MGCLFMALERLASMLASSMGALPHGACAWPCALSLLAAAHWQPFSLRCCALATCMSHHVTTHNANGQVKGERIWPPPRSFGALLVPDISSEFYKAQVTYLDGTPLLLAGLISTGQGCRNSLFQIDLKYPRLKVPFFYFFPAAYKILPTQRSALHLLLGRLLGLCERSGCSRTDSNFHLGKWYWPYGRVCSQHGISRWPLLDLKSPLRSIGAFDRFKITVFHWGVSTVYFSHAAYRMWTYDPAAGRPRDMMVGSNKTSLPAGTGMGDDAISGWFSVALDKVKDVLSESIWTKQRWILWVQKSQSAADRSDEE